LYGKNDFAEGSKNFAEYKNQKIILLGYQNKFVGTLKIISDVVTNFGTTNWFERST